MTAILLYSHQNEPITSVLLSCKLDMDIDFIKLPIKVLLEGTSIFDELDENGTKIEWTLSSGTKILNSSNHYLINRVLNIPDELFEDFAEEDKSYSISEFRAYLAFAIEAFPKCSSKPGAFGLCGNRFSLPRQWEIVRSLNLDLTIPDYYLGDLNLFDKVDIYQLIYSIPNNYYYWKPGPNPNIDQNNMSFAFTRPKGSPIICCILGEKIKIFPYYFNEIILSDECSLKIQEVCFQITHVFNYNIAEILLFLHDSCISFGMISNIPYASKNKDWFNYLLLSFMKKEISSQLYARNN